ncbi:MAG: RDD family protein [Ilumatobacteraceae bacterium]
MSPWPPPQEPPAGSSTSHVRADSQAVGGGYVLAHFGWRLLAFLADVVNLLALFAGMVVVAAVVVFSWAPAAISGLTLFSLAVATIWYRIKWEGAGGSPLRRAMGVWIVDETTLEPIGTQRGFARALVRLVSEFVLYLGYLWMLWDPKRQTWHDKVAKSIVIKK